MIPLESQVEKLLIDFIKSPQGQAYIEMVKQQVPIIVEQEIKNSSGLTRLWRLIINKFKEMFSMSTVTNAATNAAESSLNTSAQDALNTSDSGSIISNLILAANNKIKELEAEESGNSKSFYVKEIRDPFEVIVIKALVVAATAGSAAAIAELAAKVK
jgi:hypothetical protein